MSNETAQRKEFFGHPMGLATLFFTEMWERFAYYGMRAILVYYMMKHLMFAQAQTSSIYGLYTGFVYFTPILGGMLADRLLGQRKTVVIGGILMAIGEFVLAGSSLLSATSLFYLGLFIMIIGNGCFKPNISTQVGGLYAQGDHRRDRAFNIFYMGINLGAFFSPLVCGTLGERFGWHYGFGAAGVGMILGLIIYLLGQRHLAPDNIMQKKAAAKTAVKDDPLSKDDKNKILAFIVICIFTIIFWGTYEQQGNTLALWMDANTNRYIFGWQMPASWLQSFNPIMIFAFVPVISAIWGWQARRGKEPSSVAKMAIGCFLLGLSFLVMIYPARLYADSGAAVSMWWLVLCTFILTIGEIYLSPVGLSLVTKIAPVKLVSTMMGVWYLSSFFGNYFCGFLGTFWEKIPKETFFTILAVLAGGAGIGMLVMLKSLKRAIGHGREEAVDV